jgi:preprotein translocase subunit YajC
MYPQLQQLASLAVAQQGGQGGCGGPEQLALPLLMFAILYFVWLRPASKERKSHAEMLKNLKRGDRVITTSGIIGTIADKSDETLTLEVAKNVKVEMLKSSVAKRVKTPAEVAADKKDAGKKDAGKKAGAETEKKDGSEPAKKKS